MEAEGQVHYNKAKLEKRNSSKLSKEICKICRIAPLCGGGCKQRAIQDPRDGHCTMNYTEELKDEIILDKNNKFIIVEGIEALKVRNYLSLRIYKGRFFIYKNKVGTRLKDLIGKSRKYISSRVQEMIYEAIVDDVYVTDIDNFEINYVNDKVFVTFDVINIYKNYNEQITI